jgi:hypothetical protein
VKRMALRRVNVMRIARAASALIVVGPLVAANGAPWARARSAPARPAGAVEIQAPANAGKNQSAVASGVSCVSLTSCALSGAYGDSAGNSLPLVATQARGRWGRAREVALPGDAQAAHQVAQAYGVSCTGPGTCAAVGDYSAAVGEDAFIAPEVAGGWRRAFTPRLPANAVTNAVLLGVSCHGAGSCTAVGTYETNTVPDQIEGLAVSEVRGRWQPGAEIRPPSGASRPEWLELMAVSCAAARSCSAVGIYTNGAQQVLTAAASENNGRWGRAVTISAPPDASRTPSMQLNGITCTAPGWCVAVGTYRDRSGKSQALVVTETRQRWRRAAKIRPPSGSAANPSAALDSVACRRTSVCIAVGGYTSRTQATPAMLVTQVGGRWHQAVASTAVPANHVTGANEYVLLTSVVCPAGRDCVAVGLYADRPNRQQMMAATLPAP